MRLRRLELLRYGHLCDVALDLPEQAGLCVLYGPNEAGKSTTLSAIGDALFGFGHRSAYDFLHGGPQLRLGFTLLARSGRTGQFIRRKGLKNTLRTPDDAVLPDDALQPFLGGATRETFEHGFGLDGERLRQGGTALAAGGGGLGESLFAAGTGLLGLRSALDRLDEDAKALVGDGRGRRRMNQALASWREHQRQADQLAVLPKEWQAAEQARAAAVSALAELQEEAARLAAETNRLQRVRRILPVLAGLDRAHAALREVGAAPVLPPDAEQLLRNALSAQAQASADLRREQEEALRLAERRAALRRDPAVLAAREAILALAAQQPLSRQAEEALPALRLEVEALCGLIADAGRALGRMETPETLGRAVPGAAARAAVQRLIAAHAALQEKAAAAQRELAAGQARLAQAGSALRDAQQVDDPALLRATIEDVRSEGRIEELLAQATTRAETLRQDAAQALRALPLWAGDADALAACPLPLPQSTEAAGAGMAAAISAREMVETSLVALAADIRAAEDALERAADGGALPTPEAIRKARQSRDQAWRGLRRVLEGGAADSVPHPDAFEVLRDEADWLADRAAQEAQRVATYLLQSERLSRLRARLEEAGTAFAQAEAREEGARAAWQALWAPTGIKAASPVDMALWRRDRLDVLRRQQEAGDAARQRQDLLARREAAHARLTALMPKAEAETLAAALTHAEVVCSEREAAWQARRALEERQGREAAALPALQASARSAVEELESWQLRWGEAVGALGLEPRCSPAMAEGALDAWGRIAEAWPEWRGGMQRIGQMEAAVDAFTRATGTLRLSLGVTETAPALVAAELGRRLEEAQRVEAEAASLGERIEAHKQAVLAARTGGEAAAVQLAHLRALAAVTEDAALEPAIARARAHEAATRDEAAYQAALAAQGDGRDEATLRAEAAGADPDETVARLASLEEESARLGARREALSAERMRSETVLEGLRRGQDAAGAAQAARQALAEAGAAAEQYARLHMARVLLRAGIDRFRRDQQGPMLQAASRNFVSLTLGRYARLGVDEDATGKPLLVAVQADGRECHVEALSEGTRDQLYLALRMAAVEQHALAAEPLPFVADDLLVHFDDARSRAALDLLLQLGRTTQVILFTHHEHIAAMAAQRAADGVALLRLAA